MKRAPFNSAADVSALLRCYAAAAKAAWGEEYETSPIAARERDLVEQAVAQKDYDDIVGMLQERLVGLAETPIRLRQVFASLTPPETALARRILADSKRSITRILSRGRIRTDREYEQMKLYVEALEGQPGTDEELDRLYSLLDTYA